MKRLIYAALMAALAMLMAPPAKLAAAAGMSDWWGPLQNLRTVAGLEAVPIHLAKLCDGRTLAMGYERGGTTGFFTSASGFITPQSQGEMVVSITALTASVTKTIVKMSMPFDKPFNPAQPGSYDMAVCGYTAFTQEGKLKIGGLTRYAWTTAGKLVILGLPYSMEMNATGTTWTRLANEFVGTDAMGLNWRWYNTGRRFADAVNRLTGILHVGGSSLVDFYNQLAPPDDPTKRFWPNDSIEVDDGSGTNKLVVDHQHSDPDIRNETGYPAVIPQPDGTMMIIGGSGRPVNLSIDGKVLIPTQSRRTGPLEVEKPNEASSTSPLKAYWNNTGPYPNGSFITCGGQPGTSYESSCDVFDAGLKKWTTHVDMGVKRSWGSTKLLPDGRIAILGGIASDGSGGQGVVQIFDPATNTLTSGTAVMATKRGYHTTSILENDGSLFVCAGFPVEVETQSVDSLAFLEPSNCQSYWPDYAWKVKPYITGGSNGAFLRDPVLGPQALPSVSLGGTFTVTWYDGYNLRPVVDASLMALGTDTHSFDSGQAAIQLKVVKVTPTATPHYFTVTLQMPQPTAGTVASTAHLVPPGCYTLFLIDSQGVPSLGNSIKVTW